MLKKGAVIPALPLALDARRQLDPRAQRTVLRYYLDAGAGGVAVGVHSTQFAIRERGLFEPLLAFAAEEIGRHEARAGREIIKIAGACGPIEQAEREAETARRLGYDYALLSPGGLADRPERYLLDRTRAVAAILPVIGFYLQSAVGGRPLSFQYWRELCGIPGVAGVKCAPFSRYQTLDLARGAAASGRAADIALYTGNDDSIVADLLTAYRFGAEGCGAGGDGGKSGGGGKGVEVRFVGGLLGHWGVWTKKAVELLESVRCALDAGAIPADLLALGAQITDCNAAFFDAANGFRGVIPGIHEVLRRQGIFPGIWCLDESETLSPGQSAEIDRVYAAYPHLNDDAFVAENLRRWQSD
ncbi:MAG: dihydrodipicolinate synthase family protein [Clostridiales bacterium]|nr:dihydrodipicolinate synthase family protein [Clostridiales bacterium]